MSNNAHVIPVIYHKEMFQLKYEIQNSSDFFVSGFTKKRTVIEPEQTIEINVKLIPLNTGLLKLPIMKISDTELKKVLINSPHQKLIKVNY